MNKKALLVVSFGTSHAGTRKKTIEALEQTLSGAFPDRVLYRAWSSGFLIRKIKKEGLIIDSVSEALERMQKDGIQDILLQPTHMMDAQENEVLKKQLLAAAGQFSSVRIGRPLLASEADIQNMADVLPQLFPMAEKEDALVLVGHGTEHAENAVYQKVQDRLHAAGHPHIFLGTVEAKPDLQDVLNRLAALDRAPRKVWLAPFLIVAGEHATEDIGGDGNDSWKSRLTASGYTVETVLRGLGEYAPVHQLFVQHAKEAVFLT